MATIDERFIKRFLSRLKRHSWVFGKKDRTNLGLSGGHSGKPLPVKDL
jgi:hypothetical protein